MGFTGQIKSLCGPHLARGPYVVQAWSKSFRSHFKLLKVLYGSVCLKNKIYSISQWKCKKWVAYYLNFVSQQPLNVITLGQTKSDNINRMITIAGYSCLVSFSRWDFDYYSVADVWVFSHTHLNLKYLFPPDNNTHNNNNIIIINNNNNTHNNNNNNDDVNNKTTQNKSVC